MSASIVPFSRSRSRTKAKPFTRHKLGRPKWATSFPLLSRFLFGPIRSFFSPMVQRSRPSGTDIDWAKTLSTDKADNATTAARNAFRLEDIEPFFPTGLFADASADLPARYSAGLTFRFEKYPSVV